MFNTFCTEISHCLFTRFMCVVWSELWICDLSLWLTPLDRNSQWKHRIDTVGGSRNLATHFFPNIPSVGIINTRIYSCYIFLNSYLISSIRMIMCNCVISSSMGMVLVIFSFISHGLEEEGKQNVRWNLFECCNPPPSKFNINPEKFPGPNRKVVFQPPFFKGYLKLLGCTV